jgi:hypothetical protein
MPKVPNRLDRLWGREPAVPLRLYKGKVWTRYKLVPKQILSSLLINHARNQKPKLILVSREPSAPPRRTVRTVDLGCLF